MFFTLCVVWASPFFGLWALLGYAVSWALAFVDFLALLFVYILGKPSGKPIRCNFLASQAAEPSGG